MQGAANGPGSAAEENTGPCTVVSVMCPACAGAATLAHHKAAAPDGGFGHPQLRVYGPPGASARIGNYVGPASESCALIKVLSHVATTQRSCSRQRAAYGDQQGFCGDCAGQKPELYIA